MTPRPNSRGSRSVSGGDDDDLAEQGEEHRLLRPAQGHRRRLPRHLQAHHEEAEEVDVHAGHRRLPQGGLPGEQADEELWEQEQQQPHQGGVAHAHQGAEQDPQLHPAVFLRPVVKAHHGLGGAGHALDGGGDHLPHGVDDGHHPYVQVAAKGLQGGVAGHLHDGVGDGHDKAGKAQG